ncbi:MAG: 4-vinyl reductase [Candidatus Micrarchaeota archaeon]|nr:4-vinyl reductase [Candidatus Micrarchaeota archaeon]
MKAKKKTRKAPRSSRRARPAQKPGIARYEIPIGERELLTSIISKKARGRTTEYPLLLASVLSTVTPGLRSLYYKSGISAGRALYDIRNSERHYIWYEEGVSDLVSFLQNAGYKGITYNIFNDRIDIRLSRAEALDLSIPIHVFEAGLMCGFLTAARQQHVRVEEEKCICNGSQSCNFTTSNVLPLHQHGGKEVLDRFASSIKERMGAKQRMQGNFPEEYYALSSSILLSGEYSEHMGSIVYYLGNQIGSMVYVPDQRRLRKATERLYSILGLGSIRFISSKPMKIEIRFDRTKAKKEFVDISIAFLKGLMKDRLKNGLSVNVSKRGGSYIARIVESGV